MHLVFMGLVHCGNIEGWSASKHGLPVAAVFGTSEKYPKAAQIVSSRALARADHKVSLRELTPFGIPELEITKAFNASKTLIDGLYHGIDHETFEYKQSYHGPKMSDLEQMPEDRAVGRTVNDILFLNRYREPGEILRASMELTAA